MNLREKYKPVLEQLGGYEDFITDENIEDNIPNLELALHELRTCASCASPLLCRTGYPGYWYGLSKEATESYGRLKFAYIECKSAPERKRAIKLETLIESAGIKEAYKNKTFENFYVDKNNKKAYEICKKYAASFSPSSGNLFLYSEQPGTGKTHLACAITNELLKR
ncbi:MAG TPA: DnaA/Hda family protein, partial [Fervidobacterium sp.]|nr:DnaA/Hda family protein [Fervidobacterium sp.]